MQMKFNTPSASLSSTIKFDFVLALFNEPKPLTHVTLAGNDQLLKC